MAITLRTNIGANDTVFDVVGVDVLTPGQLKTIGSEYVVLRTVNGVMNQPGFQRVTVERGQLGTAPAAHSAAAAMTTTVLGGGGSVTPAAFVEPTTATPEAIVDAMITAELMEPS